MADTSNFALRMPPEIKTAAKALTNRISFNEPMADKPGYIRNIYLGSINEALVYLMKTGLRQTLEYIDEALIEKTERLNAYQDFMTFFLANPAAKEVRPANLAEGSAGRKWIEEAVAEYDPHPDEAEYDPSVISRREASSEYSTYQEWVFRLTEAKGTIQMALMTKAA